MKENEWTWSIKELLEDSNLGENIYFDILTRVPYAKEIISYDLDFTPIQQNQMGFETDLLVYEKTDIIKPRIIIEAKINSITTQDVFVGLIKKEIDYSRKIESMIYNSRMRGREKYFLLQKELRLEEI